MNSFHYLSAAQQIYFGAGALEQLGQTVAQFGLKRVLLCTIPRLQRSGLVDRLADLIGPALVARYCEVQPHVQETQLQAALKLARQQGIDAVIGLGGGSPIGMAKAVSMGWEEMRTGEPAQARFPTAQPLIPVIAIPTTYSGSELTPIYGITSMVDGTARKQTITDPKVSPKVVIYDPELTLELPAEMTASSGINALAHCIEAVYSITRNPIATAAALQGIRHINASLAAAVAQGSSLKARTELLLGAYLAASAVSTAKIGLHHGLCHVLGGTAGVPHGIANAIMLPHAMRFNADAAPSELAACGRAMGIRRGDDARLVELAVQRVFDLVEQIGLPQRLRDAGVRQADLANLAQIALHNKAVQSNPKPISSTAQILSVFQAAW